MSSSPRSPRSCHDCRAAAVADRSHLGVRGAVPHASRCAAPRPQRGIVAVDRRARRAGAGGPRAAASLSRRFGVDRPACGSVGRRTGPSPRHRRRRRSDRSHQPRLSRSRSEPAASRSELRNARSVRCVGGRRAGACPLAHQRLSRRRVRAGDRRADSGDCDRLTEQSDRWRGDARGRAAHRSGCTKRPCVARSRLCRVRERRSHPRRPGHSQRGSCEDALQSLGPRGLPRRLCHRHGGDHRGAPRSGRAISRCGTFRRIGCAAARARRGRAR